MTFQPPWRDGEPLMADRGRRTSERRDTDEGFLRRWSRRKIEARTTAAPTEDPSDDPAERAPAAPPQAPQPDAEAPPPIEPEDLPDVESLDANSDYTVFMRPGVPPEIRKQALRKLWRSDPLLANLDGLLEYGEDYTVPSWPKGAVRTAYQIGRGFVTELEKIGAAGDQPGAPEEPVSGPAPEAGAVAAAAAKPPRDDPRRSPQPAPGPTTPEERRTAEPGAPATDRPRPLPRRG
jgi:Protein of unknown function (DUF3306)